MPEDIKGGKESNIAELFSEWVEQYSDALFSWAFYKTSNRAVAEDLVQETFLAAYKAFDTFRGRSNPRTWLFAILNHKIADYHREKSRSLVVFRSELTDEEQQTLDVVFDEEGNWKDTAMPNVWDTTGEIARDPEFIELLYKCLASLPQLWESVMVLKYLTQKKGTEICTELGITSSAYWQILHRARIRLRECIEKNWLTNDQ